jgi:DNA-binding NarL/FixJ family response regulator
MKNILLACNPSQIDNPLRRSLAHLARSCQIDIAHDGYLVLEELYAKAFDLIIIDFAIGGVDSLELIESIQYIDPGVPVILLIPQTHQAIANTARQLKAQPFVRPFKPLSFLRLVDQLLHQHLNRYRQLAKTLHNTIEFLRARTEAACAFLVEETGQTLAVSGEVSSIPLEVLSSLTVQSYTQAEEFESLSRQEKTWYVCAEAEQAYSLYTTAVTESLYLALIVDVRVNSYLASAIWSQLDHTVAAIRQALQSQTSLDLLELVTADSTPNRFFLPLKPKGDLVFGNEPVGCAARVDDIAINWQIITQAPHVLNRLQTFCRVG